jgi:hypothetical protein
MAQRDESGSTVDPTGKSGLTGENQGVKGHFSSWDIADAFGVDIQRVHNAFAGEFELDQTDQVDSQQAQHLAEVILGDKPLADQEAALMQLGAYTPRRDTIEASVAEKPAGEQSDRIRRSEEAPEFGPPDVPGE